MGAIYRHAGQLDEAERNYLYALELDPWERSAMNNLMVLYRLQQRQEEYRYWLARVQSYREDNPYYHAWLGDKAAEEEDWRGALGHYLEAVSLSQEDAYLLYTTAVIYSELDENRAAQRYAKRALGVASLYSQRARYQSLLDELQMQQLAGG
jgi:Flp pilus assembly protein TadD